MDTTIEYWGYIGTMKNKMEITLKDPAKYIPIISLLYSRGSHFRPLYSCMQRKPVLAYNTPGIEIAQCR